MLINWTSFQFDRGQNFPFDWPALVSNILTVRGWTEPDIVGRNFTSRIRPMWGQPSIYFPIGDHVNVSWCCSHTNASGVISTSHIVASHITKLPLSFRQILQFRFWDNPQGRIPPWKVTKTRPFLSMCYGDPSATEVPPCCETATKKFTFSTTSVLLLLNMPLSLSRATIFRRQKNPRRVYRPKIAGILFVCNEPEGKYYTVP